MINDLGLSSDFSNILGNLNKEDAIAKINSIFKSQEYTDNINLKLLTLEDMLKKLEEPEEPTPILDKETVTTPITQYIEDPLPGATEEEKAAISKQRAEAWRYGKMTDEMRNIHNELVRTKEAVDLIFKTGQEKIEDLDDLDLTQAEISKQRKAIQKETKDKIIAEWRKLPASTRAYKEKIINKGEMVYETTKQLISGVRLKAPKLNQLEYQIALAQDNLVHNLSKYYNILTTSQLWQSGKSEGGMTAGDVIKYDKEGNIKLDTSKLRTGLQTIDKTEIENQIQKEEFAIKEYMKELSPEEQLIYMMKREGKTNEEILYELRIQRISDHIQELIVVKEIVDKDEIIESAIEAFPQMELDPKALNQYVKKYIKFFQSMIEPTKLAKRYVKANETDKENIMREAAALSPELHGLFIKALRDAYLDQAKIDKRKQENYLGKFNYEAFGHWTFNKGFSGDDRNWIQLGLGKFDEAVRRGTRGMTDDLWGAVTGKGSNPFLKDRKEAWGFILKTKENVEKLEKKAEKYKKDKKSTKAVLNELTNEKKYLAFLEYQYEQPDKAIRDYTDIFDKKYKEEAYKIKSETGNLVADKIFTSMLTAAEMGPPMVLSMGASLIPIVGPAIGTLMWTAITQQDLYADLITSGYDEETAYYLSSMAALPIAAVEMLQVRGFTPAFMKGLKGVASKGMMEVAKKWGPRVAKTYLIENLEEAIQDAMTEVIHAVAAEMEGKEYDFDRIKDYLAARPEVALSMLWLQMPMANFDFIQDYIASKKTIVEVEKYTNELRKMLEEAEQVRELNFAENEMLARLRLAEDQIENLIEIVDDKKIMSIDSDYENSIIKSAGITKEEFRSKPVAERLKMAEDIMIAKTRNLSLVKWYKLEPKERIKDRELYKTKQTLHRKGMESKHITEDERKSFATFLAARKIMLSGEEKLFKNQKEELKTIESLIEKDGTVSEENIYKARELLPNLFEVIRLQSLQMQEEKLSEDELKAFQKETKKRFKDRNIRFMTSDEFESMMKEQKEVDSIEDDDPAMQRLNNLIREVEGAEGLRMRGNEIIIITNNLLGANAISLDRTRAGRASEVIRHELVGHLGLRNIFTQTELNKLFDNIIAERWQDIEKTDILDLYKTAYPIDMDTLIKLERKDGGSGEDIQARAEERYLKSRRFIAEEFLVSKAEENLDQSFLEKVYRLIRDLLSAKFPNLKLVVNDVTDGNLRRILLTSKEQLEKKSASIKKARKQARKIIRRLNKQKAIAIQENDSKRKAGLIRRIKAVRSAIKEKEKGFDTIEDAQYSYREKVENQIPNEDGFFPQQFDETFNVVKLNHQTNQNDFLRKRWWKNNAHIKRLQDDNIEQQKKIEKGITRIKEEEIKLDAGDIGKPIEGKDFGTTEGTRRTSVYSAQNAEIKIINNNKHIEQLQKIKSLILEELRDDYAKNEGQEDLFDNIEKVGVVEELPEDEVVEEEPQILLLEDGGIKSMAKTSGEFNFIIDAIANEIQLVDKGLKDELAKSASSSEFSLEDWLEGKYDRLIDIDRLQAIIDNYLELKNKEGITPETDGIDLSNVNLSDGSLNLSLKRYDPKAVVGNFNFRKWFEASRAVDKNGLPMLFKQTGENVYEHIPLPDYYFGQAPIDTDGAVYLKMNRPADFNLFTQDTLVRHEAITLDSLLSNLEQTRGIGASNVEWSKLNSAGITEGLMQTPIQWLKGEHSDAVRELLQGRQHDGIILTVDEIDGERTDWITFGDNQVKSNDNDGSFSQILEDVSFSKIKKVKVFRSPFGDKGALVFASPNKEGIWQYSFFDKKGFWGHAELLFEGRDDLDKVRKRADDEDLFETDPSFLDNMTLTPEWQEGIQKQLSLDLSTRLAREGFNEIVDRMSEIRKDLGLKPAIEFAKNFFKRLREGESTIVPEIQPSLKREELTGDIFQFSLTGDKRISPSEDAVWQPTMTHEEVLAKHEADGYGYWTRVPGEKHPTQVRSTKASYEHYADWIKKQFSDDVEVLDHTSGLGHGTQVLLDRGIKAEAYEPYPQREEEAAPDERMPDYRDPRDIEKKYDIIISNAQLNVLPQDQRDAAVLDMKRLLKPGGAIIVNVRSVKNITRDNYTPLNLEVAEYFVPGTKSYQKGFFPKELRSYLQDALGDEFLIENTDKHGVPAGGIAVMAFDQGKKVGEIKEELVQPTLFSKAKEAEQPDLFEGYKFTDKEIFEPVLQTTRVAKLVHELADPAVRAYLFASVKYTQNGTMLEAVNELAKLSEWRNTDIFTPRFRKNAKQVAEAINKEIQNEYQFSLRSFTPRSDQIEKRAGISSDEIDRARDLNQQLEDAYQEGMAIEFIQNLETELEDLYESMEERIYDISEDEYSHLINATPSVREKLSMAWEDYLDKEGEMEDWTKKQWRDHFDEVLMDAALNNNIKLRPLNEISDEMIFDGFKDAYESREILLEKMERIKEEKQTQKITFPGFENYAQASLKRKYAVSDVPLQNIAPYSEVKDYDPDSYASAKKNGEDGINDAAYIINKFATKSMINKLGLQKYPNPVLLPVYSDDIFISGNALPITLAAKISTDTGIPVSTDILQAEKIGKTGTLYLDRIMSDVPFIGEVDKNKNYIIIDNHTETGGTAADLIDYIRSNGGNVAQVISLTGNTNTLKQSETMIEAIEERFGYEKLDKITRKYGLGSIKKATNAELAGLIQEFETIDEFEDILKAETASKRTIESSDESVQFSKARRLEPFLEGNALDVLHKYFRTLGYGGVTALELENALQDYEAVAEDSAPREMLKRFNDGLPGESKPTQSMTDLEVRAFGAWFSGTSQADLNLELEREFFDENRRKVEFYYDMAINALGNEVQETVIVMPWFDDKDQLAEMIRLAESSGGRVERREKEAMRIVFPDEFTENANSFIELVQNYLDDEVLKDFKKKPIKVTPASVESKERIENRIQMLETQLTQIREAGKGIQTGTEEYENYFDELQEAAGELRVQKIQLAEATEIEGKITKATEERVEEPTEADREWREAQEEVAKEKVEEPVVLPMKNEDQNLKAELSSWKSRLKEIEYEMDVIWGSSSEAEIYDDQEFKSIEREYQDVRAKIRELEGVKETKSIFNEDEVKEQAKNKVLDLIGTLNIQAHLFSDGTDPLWDIMIARLYGDVAREGRAKVRIAEELTPEQAEKIYTLLAKMEEYYNSPIHNSHQRYAEAVDFFFSEELGLVPYYFHMPSTEDALRPISVSESMARTIKPGSAESRNLFDYESANNEAREGWEAGHVQNTVESFIKYVIESELLIAKMEAFARVNAEVESAVQDIVSAPSDVIEDAMAKTIIEPDPQPAGEVITEAIVDPEVSELGRKVENLINGLEQMNEIIAGSSEWGNKIPILEDQVKDFEKKFNEDQYLEIWAKEAKDLTAEEAAFKLVVNQIKDLYGKLGVDMKIVTNQFMASQILRSMNNEYEQDFSHIFDKLKFFQDIDNTDFEDDVKKSLKKMGEEAFKVLVRLPMAPLGLVANSLPGSLSPDIAFQLMDNLPSRSPVWGANLHMYMRVQRAGLNVINHFTQKSHEINKIAKKYNITMNSKAGKRLSIIFDNISGYDFSTHAHLSNDELRKKYKIKDATNNELNFARHVNNALIFPMINSSKEGFNRMRNKGDNVTAPTGLINSWINKKFHKIKKKKILTLGLTEEETNWFDTFDALTHNNGREESYGELMNDLEVYQAKLKEKGFNDSAKFWKNYLDSAILGKVHDLDNLVGVGTNEPGKIALQKLQKFRVQVRLTGNLSWTATTQWTSYGMTAGLYGFWRSTGALPQRFNWEEMTRKQVIENVALQIKHSGLSGRVANVGDLEASLRSYEDYMEKINGKIIAISDWVEYTLDLASAASAEQYFRDRGMTEESELEIARFIGTSRTQSMYNRESRPIILNSDVLKVIFPHQSYSFTFFNNLLEIAANNDSKKEKFARAMSVFAFSGATRLIGKSAKATTMYGLAFFANIFSWLGLYYNDDDEKDEMLYQLDTPGRIDLMKRLARNWIDTAGSSIPLIGSMFAAMSRYVLGVEQDYQKRKYFGYDDELDKLELYKQLPISGATSEIVELFEAMDLYNKTDSSRALTGQGLRYIAPIFGFNGGKQFERVLETAYTVIYEKGDVYSRKEYYLYSLGEINKMFPSLRPNEWAWNDAYTILQSMLFGQGRSSRAEDLFSEWELAKIRNQYYALLRKRRRAKYFAKQHKNKDKTNVGKKIKSLKKYYKKMGIKLNSETDEMMTNRVALADNDIPEGKEVKKPKASKSLIQRGMDLIRLKKDIDERMNELKIKKKEIAPLIKEKPLETPEGTIVYVNGGRSYILSKDKVRQALMSLLGMSKEAADNVLRNGASEKIVRDYVKILLEG